MTSKINLFRIKQMYIWLFVQTLLMSGIFIANQSNGRNYSSMPLNYKKSNPRAIYNSALTMQFIRDCIFKQPPRTN